MASPSSENEPSGAKGKSPASKLFIAASLLILLGDGAYAHHAGSDTPEAKISPQQAMETLTAREINSSDDGNKLLDAARKGDAELVKQLISTGADVNKADADGWTPLLSAADNGHTEIVKLLLGVLGIDLNRANKYGASPLERAQTEEIKRLLSDAGGKAGKELGLRE